MFVVTKTLLAKFLSIFFSLSLSVTTGMIETNNLKGSDEKIGAFPYCLDFKLLDAGQEDNT